MLEYTLLFGKEKTGQRHIIKHWRVAGRAQDRKAHSESATFIPDTVGIRFPSSSWCYDKRTVVLPCYESRTGQVDTSDGCSG